MPRALGGGNIRFSTAMVSALAFQSEITSEQAGWAIVVRKMSVGMAALHQSLRFDMAVSF